MPPIMGAAAFIMAQYLGTSYNTIMIAALVPAILYYVSVFSWVHFYARKHNIYGLKRSEIPPIENFTRKLTLLLPLGVIIWALFSGYTPIYAAFYGMIATVIAAIIQKKKFTLANLTNGLRDGAFSSINAIIACIAAGIIVGVSAMTGIGQVITYNIVGLAGNNLFFALLLTACASLILSMGLPATACYIVVGTIVAPALVKMGAIPLAAHMFVFYFSCLSNITPPVAIACYTAAGIANAKPFGVAWKSVLIAAPGFLIPFLFTYNPVLLCAKGCISFFFLLSVFTALIGVVFMAIAGTGYFIKTISPIPRLLFFAGSILLIFPGLQTDIIGFIVIVVASLPQIRVHTKSRSLKD